jgi:DNA-binding beta-propeller fold protein YncE
LVRKIGLPPTTTGGTFGLAAGETLTADGRYLLVADGSGAAVISVARAEADEPDPAAGVLSAPASASRSGPVGGAIEVTTSRDDRFAFVSLEYDDRIAVFNLRAALTDRFRSSSFVGTITLGQAVVGTAVSPDGRWLYATSELAAGAHPTPVGQSGPSAYGTLSVIDLQRAETEPARAVVTTVQAGCGPVRVAVSPDGSVVLVTARESDELLAFSAARLLNDSKHALLATVRVGEAPVGLAVVANGRYIVVADSNRFQLRGATSALTIVDTHAMLTGQPSVVGTVPAGKFPRELAVSPTGKTLLVTNFASGQLEAIDLTSLTQP